MIVVRFSGLLLNIDIKPDLRYNPETEVRVVSKSRVFAGVRMQLLQSPIIWNK